MPEISALGNQRWRESWLASLDETQLPSSLFSERDYLNKVFRLILKYGWSYRQTERYTLHANLFMHVHPHISRYTYSNKDYDMKLKLKEQWYTERRLHFLFSLFLLRLFLRIMRNIFIEHSKSLTIHQNKIKESLFYCKVSHHTISICICIYTKLKQAGKF